MQKQEEMKMDLKSQFTGSKKVYVQGSRLDIQVPMREICLGSTVSTFGQEENEPVRVYDTSGPYTDSTYTVDIRKGLPAVRKTWIEDRKDIERYEGRDIKPEDNGLSAEDPRANIECFPNVNKSPLRAKKAAM